MPLIKSKSPAVAPGPEADEPGLEELLADFAAASSHSRRAAARGLGDHPSAASTLCGALAGEAHESVRVAIFTALIKIGTKPAAAGLIRLLQSEDVGLRNGAIEALKTMPDSSSECLSEIFASSTDVRIFGVEILGSLVHPDRQSWLLQVIEADSELNVCAAAVEALLECGDQRAVPLLNELIGRFPDEPFLEFSIRTVLAHIETI